MGTPSIPDVVLIGAESSGKTTLAGALSGASPRAENLAGSTTAVERFSDGSRSYLDTPGIVHRIDTESTRLALETLEAGRLRSDGDGTPGRAAAGECPDPPVVLLVVRATHLDDELAELLPLVSGRPGVVALTQWDRVQETPAAHGAVALVSAETGVPFVLLDARHPGPTLRALHDALARPGHFTGSPVAVRAGWRIEPPPTILEHRWLGPPLGLVLLLTPAVLAVRLATGFADRIEPTVDDLVAAPAAAASELPRPLADVLAGDYGLLTMGPLLLVWALPVVVLLALLLGLLRASGLLDRLTTAVHPLVRPFGLTGRDLVRIVAGHGCNVPAVIATRSCSGCTRDATVGAIAFGAACSFQLAATLAVLTAAGRPALIAPYLMVLLGGALVHARLLARAEGVDPVSLDLHLLRGRSFLTRPTWSATWLEARSTLSHVTLRALPVFLAITVIAALLTAAGAVEVAARGGAPVLAALRLPADTALPIVLASIRKDGLLLLAEPGTVAALDAAQLLAALLLAGALVPCLVTTLTIWRERGSRVAVRLLGRQAVGALVLAGSVAWLGALLVTVRS